MCREPNLVYVTVPVGRCGYDEELNAILSLDDVRGLPLAATQ